MCPNGHVVDDETALRCPHRGCGAWISGQPPAPPARHSSPTSTVSAGVRLILISFVPALIGAVALMMFIDRDLDPTTSSGALVGLICATAFFLSNTLFLIGCVAEGVRVGNNPELKHGDAPRGS